MNSTSTAHADGSTSFRDPAGRLFHINGRIIREVQESGRPSIEAAYKSAVLREFIDAGHIVATRRLEPFEVDGLVASREITAQLASRAPEVLLVEHERIAFASFPYEWSPEMLYDAASLTLDLSDSLLTEGLGLKDATPYNILFRSQSPVFVDVLSFEKRRADDPIWIPYAQFIRTFLLPLLAYKQFGTPLAEMFLTHRDGLEAEDVYRQTSVLTQWLPNFLMMVSIPTWLQKWQRTEDPSLYTPRHTSTEQAAFLLKTTFRSLRRRLKSVAPCTGRSRWSEYQENNSYSQAQAAEKQAFVERVMRDFRPRTVLDVGCNTGQFSITAAREGARVMAIDKDQTVVGRLYKTARQENLAILPLVIDIARPSPGVGWKNRECPSFLDRASGSFDAVFMLALLHHLLVTERVPLAEIIDLAAELTSDLLIVEYVGPDDPMFQKLIRGRAELHSDFNRKTFEVECKRLFDMVGCQELRSNRCLYVMRKKS